MESQRVRGLLSGYLHGWLTLAEPATPTSWLREEIILRKIYDDEYTDVVRTKLLSDAILSSAMSLSKEQAQHVGKLYDSYLALKLPYAVVNAKIKEEPTATSMDDWKQLLNKMNK